MYLARTELLQVHAEQRIENQIIPISVRRNDDSNTK